MTCEFDCFAWAFLWSLSNAPFGCITKPSTVQGRMGKIFSNVLVFHDVAINSMLNCKASDRSIGHVLWMTAVFLCLITSWYSFQFLLGFYHVQSTMKCKSCTTAVARWHVRAEADFRLQQRAAFVAHLQIDVLSFESICQWLRQLCHGWMQSKWRVRRVSNDLRLSVRSPAGSWWRCITGSVHSKDTSVSSTKCVCH